MVYFIKFNSDDEPKQFTTALEAKEHIEAEMPKDGSVLFAFAEEVPEDLSGLDFASFDDREKAREAVDEAKSESQDGNGSSDSDESSEDDEESK